VPRATWISSSFRTGTDRTCAKSTGMSMHEQRQRAGQGSQARWAGVGVVLGLWPLNVRQPAISVHSGLRRGGLAWYLVRSSPDRGALMSFLRSLDGAVKCACARRVCHA